MTPDRLKNRRLASVFFLGWILFNYPILSLFSRPLALMGIPLLYVYVFCAWAVIIALVVLSTRSRRRSRKPER